MDDSKEYGSLKQVIDLSYRFLMKQQEVWLNMHWRDFNSHKAKLEGVVSQEFGRVLGEISPLPVPEWISSRNPDAESPEILGYTTTYNPQSRIFRVKITKLKLHNGSIMDNSNAPSSQYGCPHILLESVCGAEKGVNPKIKKFKEEYSVREIDYPLNRCHHSE